MSRRAFLGLGGTAACVTLVWLLYAFGTFSVEGPTPPSERLWPGQLAQDRADGVVRSSLSPAIERFQCYRCHEIERFPVTVPGRSCVECHRLILDGSLDGKFASADLRRFKSHIRQLVAVPALYGISHRLKREWFEQFLRAPQRIRPENGAGMPRLALAESDVRAIADFFYREPSTDPPRGPSTSGSAGAGRAVFLAQGCPSCHHFTGVIDDALRVGKREGREAALAPDLRYTRDRMSAEMIERWLEDPRAINPAAVMPPPKVSAEERRDLVRFILDSELTPLPVRPRFEPLPLLTRTVSYREVETRVFKKVCWHCHSDPRPVGGDGGPGNTGGFGYLGAGLDLSSRAGVLEGVRRKDGTRYSVLAPGRDGTPPIVAHLIARHREEEGAPVPGTLGMPLALTPIPAEDIQLLASWIAQGAL